MRVAVDDGTFATFVARPAAPQTLRGSMVVLHESLGLNADIRAKCKVLADCGFLAIAPDLFWRDELGSETQAKLDRENGSGAVHSTPFDLDRGLHDIAAVVRAVRASELESSRIGVLGFGLGGLLAYLTAARLPIDAAVVYYGPRIDHFLGEAIKISIPLMLHFGEDDSLVPSDVLTMISSSLAHKANVRIHRYPASGHGFAREACVLYDGAAAELALGRTTEFLRQFLG